MRRVVLTVQRRLVTAARDLGREVGMRIHLLADEEEGRARPDLVEAVQHGRRRIDVGTVVEGQRGGAGARDLLERWEAPPALDRVELLAEARHLRARRAIAFRG